MKAGCGPERSRLADPRRPEVGRFIVPEGSVAGPHQQHVARLDLDALRGGKAAQVLGADRRHPQNLGLLPSPCSLFHCASVEKKVTAGFDECGSDTSQPEPHYLFQALAASIPLSGILQHSVVCYTNDLLEPSFS